MSCISSLCACCERLARRRGGEEGERRTRYFICSSRTDLSTSAPSARALKSYERRREGGRTRFERVRRERGQHAFHSRTQRRSMPARTEQCGLTYLQSLLSLSEIRRSSSPPLSSTISIRSTTRVALLRLLLVLALILLYPRFELRFSSRRSPVGVRGKKLVSR